jgi:outer membrane lipoprotein-sorting protein
MKTLWRIRIALLIVAFSTVAAPADDKTPTVAEIVAKTNQVSYYAGDDGRAQVRMKIVDEQGRERAREFTILRRDDRKEGVEGDAYCGDQEFYVYFHRPADVNKMVFMVHKHLDRDDDRWLYLPALDLVKRISSADKRTSFVGSHFYYEDVSGRHIADDEHELVETTDNYYVLKNTPKDPQSVEFKYFKMWIHKTSFVVVKTEYYDGNDKKYRTYEAKGVEDVQGFPTVTKSRMTDHRTGGYTEMAYSDVKYNVGLPEDIFTERYLRRPPREYLR